jgi:beta-glucosidase/6-phospho-beta-glucosidase/beta-galactosidase
VVPELGDLCSDWVTFNEPNVYCAMAYVPHHQEAILPADSFQGSEKQIAAARSC